jgi:hypothetical protein
MKFTLTAPQIDRVVGPRYLYYWTAQLYSSITKERNVKDDATNNNNQHKHKLTVWNPTQIKPKHKKKRKALLDANTWAPRR